MYLYGIAKCTQLSHNIKCETYQTHQDQALLVLEHFFFQFVQKYSSFKIQKDINKNFFHVSQHVQRVH